jgi:hypothetical protein
VPRPPVSVAVLAVWFWLLFEPSLLHAGAATEPFAHARLELEAAPGERCISASELEQAVQAQLGRVAFVASGAPATLLVRVRIDESAPGHFRAAVWSEPVPPTVDAPTNQRELEATGDCRSLDEQLALVVALLVDSDPEPAPSPPQQELEPPPPEPPAPPIQDTSAVSSAPSWESAPAGPWQLALGASGLVGLGPFPDAAFGAALGVLATPPAWPGLRLRAVGFAPGRASLTADAWLDLTWFFAGVAVCPELGGVGAFTFSGCLGADLTFLYVESHGLDGEPSASRFGGQASGSLLASLALGRGLQVVVEAGTAIPFATTRFTVERDGRRVELHRTPFAPVLLALGAAYEFY